MKNNNVIRHNKLVRDRIPEIIENEGNQSYIRVLTGDKVKCELGRKLIEEATEVTMAETEKEVVEELADVLEVMNELLNVLDIKWDSVYAMKQRKEREKGNFSKHFFLTEVHKPKNIDESAK